MKYIVFDVGGTSVKWAIMDGNFKIIKKDRFPTDILKIQTTGLMVKLGMFIKDIEKKYGNINGIAIGMPGVVDPVTTKIIGATPNLPGSQNLDIKKELSKFTKTKNIIVHNDANLAAMGEYVKGSMKGTNNSLLITIGTGIGSGLILNGELFLGANNWAGEVGRQFIKSQKWESIASTKALLNYVKEVTGKEMDGVEVTAKLKQKDEAITEIYHAWLDNLSQGLYNIIQVLNPETIALGGGISESPEFKMKKLKQVIMTYTSNKELINSTRIVKATLGNDAALYGAAAMLYKNK